MFNLSVNGVYMIENKVNGMKYVGANYCEHLITGRIKIHLYQLEKNKHNCTHLQLEYNKYGKDNFRIKVIEEILLEDFSNEEDYILHIKLREQYFLNYFHETLLYNTDYISRIGKSKKEKLALSRAERICYKSNVELLLQNQSFSDDEQINTPIKISRLNNKNENGRINLNNLMKTYNVLINKDNYFLIYTKSKMNYMNKYLVGFNGKEGYYLFSVIHYQNGTSPLARKYALVELENFKVEIRKSNELKLELESL